MQIVESKPFAVTILAVFMLLTSVQQAIAAPVEKVLHKFPGSGGKVPYGKLAVDAKGNLYGTTLIGGPANAGTVFKLHQLPDGTWNGRVIHGFTDTNNSIPAPGVVFDASGNLYGATTRTIFELIPPASGNGLWSEKVLYTFCLTYPCIDGALPSSVIFDPAGNLYGTTESGGLYGLGTVFELTPDASGNWTEKVLYSFNPFGSNDGTNPSAPLVRDAAGNLYGTTVFGTGTAYFGTAFELSPQADGTWAETVIHDFCSSKDCEDGLQPRHGLLLDQAGNLYGTTGAGGNFDRNCFMGCGTVFELTP